MKYFIPILDQVQILRCETGNKYGQGLNDEDENMKQMSEIQRTSYVTLRMFYTLYLTEMMIECFLGENNARNVHHNKYNNI